jgi:spermidine synthase
MIGEQNFFGDNIVYRTNDALGDILVTDDRHYRNLIFGSIFKQSSMNLEKPRLLVYEYMQVMMLVLVFIQPCHVTILGLGGGCLLRSLYHALPECELHVIELRQRVYEIAAEFFGIPISDKIKVTIFDAKQQLQETDDAATDIIFSDMYHAHGVNRFQLQKHFLNQCHRVLSKNGWLVVNYHEMPDLRSPFLKYLHSLFSKVFICSVSSGNYILFASKYWIDASSHFELVVTALEKELKIKLIHLFKRLVELNLDTRN